MFIPHTLATIAIAGWWLVLAGCLLGVGLLFLRLLGLRDLDPLKLVLAYWSGWAAVVALLQIWHLVLPVNGLALAAVGALGIGGLALATRQLAGTALQAVRAAPVSVLLCGALLLWAANRSTGPVQNYDTGLYYLPTVNWLMSFPIVPGLGNLHGRLAFNSAYFLYGALANVGPLAGRAHHIANGVLFCGLLFQGIAAASLLGIAHGRLRSFFFWSALTLAPALVYLFGIELVGSVLPNDLRLNGLSPDDAIFVLSLVGTSLLVALLFGHAELTERERAAVRVTLTMLLAVGVAVKLSFAAFAGVGVLIAYGAAVVYERPRGPRAWGGLLVPLVVCVLLIGGVWALRGMLLSGYPAYPSTLGMLPVPWRVPEPLVLSEANWVRSWARSPGPHWVTVLGSSAWLQPWLNNLPAVYTQPLWLAFAGLITLAVGAAGRPGTLGELGRGAALLAPGLASLIFWFVTAPSYRFGAGAAWAVGLGVVLLAVEHVLRWHVAERHHGLVALGVALALLLYVAPVRNPLLLAGDPTSPSGLPPLPVVAYTARETISGLTVHSPDQGDTCWNTPLPCTPYFRAGLRLREPGNLAAGFVLDTPRQYVDMHGSDLPAGVESPIELGVALPAGWHGYDPSSGVRWMAEEGIILIYSDQPRVIRLMLTPATIFEPELGLGERGRLQIRVAGRLVTTLELVSGREAGTELALARGFTNVALVLDAGSFVPNAIIPGSNDTRRLSLEVAKLRLTLQE